MSMRVPVLSIVVAIVMYAAAAHGGEGDVYIVDDAVTSQIDVGAFEKTGKVTMLEGPSEFCETERGPAPPPYPQIQVREPGYEQLGVSGGETDGVWFINGGRHWTKNRSVLVLWKIRVPDADRRAVQEYGRDMTLSLWVDWDESESWEPGELVVRRDVNIAHRLPTDRSNVTVYYLTCFRVPDVTDMPSANSGWGSGGNHEFRHFWVRGTLAYDDPDVSPDGEQVFGEAEDYRVSYRVRGGHRGEGPQ